MPELLFKGKQFVFNHHLTVPYRPLVPHPKKSIGDESENLIIHGDNLHALKALLPRYAGKVDCVCIDPPYNTGSENWRYNDNVKSPYMKEWLDGSPVNQEDMLRHDKWCCMMYPRLKLLHELLSEEGFICIFIDDNEHHRLRFIMDEIFGSENLVGVVAWKKTSGDNKPAFAFTHDNIVIYSKGAELPRRPLSPQQRKQYANPDNDPRGDWADSDYRSRWTKEERPNLYYAITNPNTGEKIYPDTHTDSVRVWGTKPSEHKKNEEAGLVWWGKDGKANEPKKKRFLSEHKGANTRSVWMDSGSNDDAGQMLRCIFHENEKEFDNPKPVSVVKRIVEIASREDGLVLDSFAGSGTTAHAVMELNAEDGGNRRFILAECEDYADNLTAERVRRVINGYKFKGTKREELLREKVTWSHFNGGNARQKLMDRVHAIENQESDRFDRIDKTVKCGELIVTGEKKIAEKVEGLGGDFTYYTLGDPLNLDKILTGKGLPDYASIGSWLFHTATGESLDAKGIKEKQNYLGESADFHVWLIYKPDLDFLKSNDSALILSVAEKIAQKKGKHHLVFASTRFVPNKTLIPMGIEHAPLPFALYRLERD